MNELKPFQYADVQNYNLFSHTIQVKEPKENIEDLEKLFFNLKDVNGILIFEGDKLNNSMKKFEEDSFLVAPKLPKKELCEKILKELNGLKAKKSSALKKTPQNDKKPKLSVKNKILKKSKGDTHEEEKAADDEDQLDVEEYDLEKEEFDNDLDEDEEEEDDEEDDEHEENIYEDFEIDDNDDDGGEGLKDESEEDDN